MLRYALIALIAVVSAEDAITVTQSNPASAFVSCGIDALVAANSDATGEHLITITHGRCKLELKPTHVNGGGTVGHMFHIAGAVADPALASGDHTPGAHNGHFETKYEDNVNSATADEVCDMDSHNRVEFQPVISSVSNNLEVTVILSHEGNDGVYATVGAYQSGYEFKQYYDDALLTAAGTNYAVNSNSWQKVTDYQGGNPDVTTTFTWASGCDDAISSTCPDDFETDITCTHIVTGTNPKGLIRATHSTVQGHTKHKCWVDHTVANALTNAAACKCQCVP